MVVAGSGGDGSARAEESTRVNVAVPRLVVEGAVIMGMDDSAVSFVCDSFSKGAAAGS